MTNLIFRNTTLTFLLLVISGLAYQSYSSFKDAKSYPLKGQLIDVGGYKLHIEQFGSGNVTVIFDAGMGDDFSVWDEVSMEVSNFAKVMGYDRAGLGWSEKSPLPRDSENIVSELHLLIQNADIRGPLILVGHSFGGVNMQLYATKYPKQIAGLILVDSAHEQQPISSSVQKYIYKAGMWAAPLGIPRLYLSLNNPIEQAKKTTVKHQYTSLDEARLFPDSLNALAALSPNFGDLPLTVIARNQPSVKTSEQKLGDFRWAKLQEELSSRSSHGRIIYSGERQHSIHKAQPEIVIEAIREMAALTN